MAWLFERDDNSSLNRLTFLNQFVALTLGADTLYHLEAIINMDYSGELRVWIDGDPRPNSPTISVSAHTPTAAGSADQIFWFNNWNTSSVVNIDVDFITVETN